MSGFWPVIRALASNKSDSRYGTTTYSIISELYRAVLERRLERVQFTSKAIQAEKIQK